MNTIRSATSIAKRISWVTTSIVIPARPATRITSRMPATSSGSSDDVASSNSISWGSSDSARAIATRCFCPPDSRAGYASTLSDSPTSASSARARCFGRRPAQAARAAQPEGEVLLGGEVGEDVEVLEHHADLGPQADQPSAFGPPEPRQPAVLVGGRYSVPVEDDRAGRRRGDEVHAAQQRALARPARTDDAHDLAALDVEVDTVEHLDRAERLGDRAESEERLGHSRAMVVCEQSIVRLAAGPAERAAAEAR